MTHDHHHAPVAQVAAGQAGVTMTTPEERIASLEQQVADLAAEVRDLRAEAFIVRKIEEMWTGAAGAQRSTPTQRAANSHLRAVR